MLNDFVSKIPKQWQHFLLGMLLVYSIVVIFRGGYQTGQWLWVILH